MPAEVSFVLGRSGAGKSRFLHGRIEELLRAGENVALIVPEQFTFETERMLSARLGGLMGVEVYSFTTLAEKALGQWEKSFLSRQGRVMAVRKAVGELGRQLQVFARVKDRPGFAAALDGQLTLFKRFDVTPEALFEAASRAGEGALGDKLRELALIYRRVEDYLGQRYMDTEDTINALIAALPGSRLAGGHVMIDGFDLLTGQLYRVMEQLMETSATLSISFRIDHSPGCRDAQVFAPERRAYARLHAAAKALGCNTQAVLLPGKEGRIWADPAIGHIEREAFAYPCAPFEGEAAAVRLFAGSSAAAECEAAAEEVLRLARLGLRYRDINIILTDSEYQLQLLRAFRRRGIPCFSDDARPLSYYGCPRLILSALSLSVRGYTLGGLMAAARTGFAGISPEQADIFENYALSKGLRGTGFTRPIEGNPEAEAARKALIEPLQALRAALAAAPTAAGKAEAVFDYMQRLGMHARASALSAELREQGRRQLAEENAQVYSRVLTVLDQLHGIMGEAPMGGPAFLSVLEEGFEAYEISAIPATADQVTIGSLGRTHARPARAMLILGANDGRFPRYMGEEGMLGDDEIAALQGLGLPGLDSSRDRYDVELMDVYCALSKASEHLYISYAMSAGSEAAAQSPIVDRLRELFPGLVPDTDLSPRPPESPEGGLNELARGLRALADTGRPEEGLPELYAYYAGRPMYKEELDRLESALYYRCSPEPFGRELALKLYGDALYGSATRLERYNACPFRHFVRYGLRAEERREYKERRADEGAFCHAALEAFVKAAAAGDIRSLDEEGCYRLLEELLPPIIAAHNGGVLTSSARNLALCARLVRTVKATAWAIVCQAKSGQFLPRSTEVSFGQGGLPALRLTLPTGESFLIGGRIDRIDGCTIDGEQYYRVVDYKGGASGFDYAKLYHGLSLQLPLYVAAIAAVERTARAAGMYYMPVKYPVTAEEEAPLAERLMKEFRLSGLTLSNPEVVAATAGQPGRWVIPTGGNARGFATEEELTGVVEYARQKSSNTLREIYRGGAEASPARLRQNTECDWCESRSVCGFDTRLPGCQYRRLSPLNREDFFAAIAKEGQDELD